MSIEINNINKFFGSTKVLNNINLNIPSNKIVALLGPSGSGKTTLLRIIAGLEHQDSGKIKFYGKDITYLHAKDRHVGFVFQNYALFRHMTVFNNIIFGLTILPKNKRPSNLLIKKKANKILKMIKLSNFSDRYPSQLSGGQKQRVALARALIIKPQILLLDEPFGALDTKVRKELRKWLRKLHKELKFTSVFVTHDQDEAMEVADRVVVMSNGNIEQLGKPEKILKFPATRFVLQFLGEVNKFNGRVEGSYFYIGSYHWSLGYFPNFQGNVDVFLRPWEIDISFFSNLDTPLPAKIINCNLNHYFWQITVQTNWHYKLINLTINVKSVDFIPVIGLKCFIGLSKARIYNKEKLLNI